MFLPLFFLSLGLLLVGITGHIGTMYKVFREVCHQGEPSFPMVFFIFVPMAALGFVGAVVAVVLRYFEYIR